MNRRPILIAEDEDAIRLALSLLLRRHGFQVEEARNGKDALSLLRSRRFALLITDIQMPEMDGLDLLAAVEKQGDRPPVIVISGYGNRQLLSLLDGRVSAYLDKPFQAADLIAQVNRVLDREQGRES